MVTPRGILVTGGTGLIGRQLLVHLVARGEHVTVLSRNCPWVGSEGGAAEAGATGGDAAAATCSWPEEKHLRWIRGDVAAPRLDLSAEAYDDLVRTTGRIFHLAARTDFTGGEYGPYEAVNVLGCGHVLELARAAGASLHQVSTAFVCGDHRGRFAEGDLDLGQGFRNHYERSKYEAERLLVARAAAAGVPLAIYRPGIVIESEPAANGTAKTGPLLYVEALARLVAKRLGRAAAAADATPGALRVLGDPDACLPLVFDHETAAALVALSERPDATGRVYHLVPAMPVPNRLLEEGVNAAFGRAVVRWATEREWLAAPLSPEETLLHRKGNLYAPYRSLDVQFDRANLDAALGREALPGPTRAELEATFLAFLEARRDHEAGSQPSRAAGASAPAPAEPAEDLACSVEVRRYFETFLPRFLDRPLLPNLRGLTAAFWIETGADQVWSLEIRAGILHRLTAGERCGTFGYRIAAEPFLRVARGMLAPQETFFAGQTHLDGNKVEALKTATVLEEFFRSYPLGETDRPQAGPKGTLIPLREVPERPWSEVVGLARKHLNRGLIDLLELGEFTAVEPVAAEGAYIIDRSGRRILDLVSSYGALNLGHNHPRVCAAVEAFRRDRRLDLCKEFVSRYAAALAHNLTRLTPGDLDSVYFCNSGAEAMEAALKLAQRYHQGRRWHFIYAHGSMHGKTIGALSVTGGEPYRAGFRLLPHFPVPYGDLAAIERLLDIAPTKGEGAIAGVVLEPIQGEAGVVVPPRDYLPGVRKLCDRYGALLILDEVQTGLGRTGTLFGCEADGVVPDIMALAKTLGGSVASLAATVARSGIYRKAYGNPHDCLIQTSTFGGRASACAAGIATLEVLLEEGLAQRARKLGEHLLGRLAQVAERHPDWIAAVRGRGLMIGIEFRNDLVQRLGSLALRLPGLRPVIQKHVPGMVAAALLKRHGILCSLMLNHRSVLRVYPALVAGQADLDRFADALDEVLRDGFEPLVRGRLRHAVAHGAMKFFVPWLAAGQSR